MTHHNTLYFFRKIGIAMVFSMAISMNGIASSTEQTPTENISVGQAPVENTPKKVTTQYQPLAMVNDKPITPVDIDNRVQFIRIINKIPKTIKLSAQDKNRILEDLIEEKIKTQETERFKVKIDEKRLDDAFKAAANNLGISEKDFADTLRRHGLDRAYFDRVTGDKFAWSDLVQGRYARDISISTYEIAQIIEANSLTDGMSVVYHQIVLPFDGSPKAQTDIQVTLDDISKRLKQGEAFKTIAMGYNPNAAIQTKLLSELSPELGQTLLTLQPEQISQPIKINDTLIIAQFIDKQKGDTSVINQRMTIKSGRLTYKEDSNTQQKQAILHDLNTQSDLCKEYDTYLADVTVFNNTTIAELPESLRDVAKATKQGETRIVRESKDNDYVLTVCEIKKPDYYNDVPNEIRSKTRNQIFSNKLELKDKEYYRDLKKSALVTLFQ